MSPLYEIFLDYGGLYIVLLGVLSWIAFTQLSEIKDEAQRWVKALSKGWLMKSAVGIALSSWAWNFGRLFFGDAYLRGAGSLPQLSTILLCLILVIAGVAWWGISRRLQGLQPWITQGLAVALIVSAGKLLVDAPKGNLSLATIDDKQRPAVAFVQGRLASLGCFEAVGVPKPREGSFDALTALAVISFQSANDLLNDPRVDTTPGEIAPREFRLLARPFLDPERCPRPEMSRNRHP